MKENTLPLRYLARLTVQAETPLAVGSGEMGLGTDELVSTDVNGFPMIPGTGLCGVLRRLAETEMSEVNIDDIFGFHGSDDEGKGARLVLSSARLVGQDGIALDGYVWETDSPFNNRLRSLPVRDHCRINDRGVADAESHGKYDEQVVFRGARFIFDIELSGNKDDTKPWRRLLGLFNSPLFRVGGGTRKGFGELSVVEIIERIYDLRDSVDLSAYLERSTSLTEPIQGVNVLDEKAIRYLNSVSSYIEYELTLRSEDFFSFGAGYGDDEADSICKTEEVIQWRDSIPSFSDEYLLLPATSVKGALSHRVAFHYNLLTSNFVDGKIVEEISGMTCEKNAAVRALFGFAKGAEGDTAKEGCRGIVILSDTYLNSKDIELLNHVSIDRFTCGALDGALFTEEVATSNVGEFQMHIHVGRKAFNGLEDNIVVALEKSLKDITTGHLPLGGAVMRGHGCFSGRVTRDGKEL